MTQREQQLTEALKAILYAHIEANIAEATTPELREACRNARKLLSNP